MIIRKSSKKVCLLTLALSITMALPMTTVNAKEVTSSHKSTDIQGAGHISNLGWQGFQKEGQLIGTTGQSRRLEAVKITLDPSINGSIQYKVHSQNVGWGKATNSGNVAGTTGKALRAEAITIQLTGEAAKMYDIEYQAHVQNIGWMQPVRNGAVARTSGRALRMEALRIKLIDKQYDDDPSKPTNENKYVTINIDVDGKKLSSTAGYTKITESTDEGSVQVLPNGNTITTFTTTVVWKKTTSEEVKPVDPSQIGNSGILVPTLSEAQTLAEAMWDDPESEFYYLWFEVNEGVFDKGWAWTTRPVMMNNGQYWHTVQFYIKYN